MSEWLKNRFSLRVILLLQLKNIRWMHLSIIIANTIISCQITTPHFACWCDLLDIHSSSGLKPQNVHIISMNGWFSCVLVDHYVSQDKTWNSLRADFPYISCWQWQAMCPKSRQREISNLGPCSDREIKYSPQLFWILINIRVPRKPSMNLRNANCQLDISPEVPQDRQQHHQSQLSIVVSMWLLSDIGTFMVLVSPTTWSKDLLHYEIESIFVNHLLSPSNAASRLLVPAFWLEWDPVAARCIFRFAHFGYSWITTSIVSNCFCRDCFVAGCIKILLKPSNFEVPEAPASLLAGGDRSRTHFAQA